MDPELFSLGFVMVIFGVILSMIGILLAALRSSETGAETEAGGLVMIGPVPIIFSSSKRLAKLMLLLAFIMMLFMLMLMLSPFIEWS